MASRLSRLSRLSRSLNLAPFLVPALQRARPKAAPEIRRQFASLVEVSNTEALPPHTDPTTSGSTFTQHESNGIAPAVEGSAAGSSALAIHNHESQAFKPANPPKRHHGLNTSMLFRPNEKVFVSIRRPSGRWKKDFAKLQTIIRDNVSPESVGLDISQDSQERAKELHGWSTESKLRKSFDKLDLKVAAFKWEELFKAAIVFNPEHALRLVKLTFPAPYIHDYAIKGALELLIMQFAVAGEPMRQATASVIVTALAQLLKSRAGQAALPSEQMELLTHKIEVNDSAGLYSLMRVRQNVELSYSLQQRLVRLFASKKQYHRLVTVLLDMRKGSKGWEMNSPAFRLKWHQLVETCADSTELRAFHKALEEADMMFYDLYHAFTAVAYARQDSRTMWLIFKAQTERYFNTDPDKRQLLKQMLPSMTQISRFFQDAKRLRDPSRLGAVLALVANDPGYYNSTYLNAGMMHLISRTHDTGGTSQPRSKRYVQMLKHYMQYFDCSALQRLGLPVPDRSEWITTATLQPAPHQLRILMIGYILSQNPGPRFGSNIRLIYQNLMAAADNGNPIAIDLVKDTLIFDHVIAHISWDITELPFCTTVMKDVMFRSKQYEANPAESLRVGPPIERTWSALHFAFCSRSQMASAARVRQMMVDQGFPLLPKTWNDVIKGYGRMQHIPGIIKTMREMAENDIEFNDDTVRNLQLIDDRDELLRQLEAVTGQDFTEYFHNAPLELKTFWSQRSTFIEHDLDLEKEEQAAAAEAKDQALDSEQLNEFASAEESNIQPVSGKSVTVTPMPAQERARALERPEAMRSLAEKAQQKPQFKPGKQSMRDWQVDSEAAAPPPPEPKDLFVKEGQQTILYENEDIDVVNYESSADLQEQEALEQTLEDLDKVVKKPRS